ncbi:MAG: hypothetical protein PHG16_02700 [Lachnospiraceae bacterium]|nr:hypothetical protein [Lachnospiraceae bacterium]
MEQTKDKKHRVFEKFRELSLPKKLLMVNVCVLLFLVIFFFLAGVYIYNPAKSARAYYEAKFQEDWNGVYDCSIFPDKTFLSRKNLVNAREYLKQQAKSSDAQIASFSLKKKSASGDQAVYTVSYSIKGDDNAYSPELKLQRGKKVLGMFYNWYVEPEELYVSQVSITVPVDTTLTLDGTVINEEYQTASKDKTTAVYRIPYLFIGGHTLELKEGGKEAYREVIQVKDNAPLTFIPELKLNDESGRMICNRAEKAIDKIYQAAAAQKDFSKVSSYFSAESQEKARTAYEKLSKKFATSKRKGITTLSITQIASSVTNKSETMTADIKLSYSADEVYKWLFFFYRTKTYTKEVESTATAVHENGVWVFDEHLIAQ